MKDSISQLIVHNTGKFVCSVCKRWKARRGNKKPFDAYGLRLHMTNAHGVRII